MHLGGMISQGTVATGVERRCIARDARHARAQEQVEICPGSWLLLVADVGSPVNRDSAGTGPSFSICV